MANYNDTKDKMIEIAHRMVANEGVESIKLRDLGDELGLSRSAIYRHFSSKEALLATMVTQHFIWFKSVLESQVNEKSIQEKARDIIKTYYTYGVENANHYRLMFDEIWDDTQYPEVYQSKKALFDYLSCITGHEESARMLYVFCHGLVSLHITGNLLEEDHIFNLDAVIDRFLEQFNH